MAQSRSGAKWAAEIAVRFEGLLGELLQIDWGEERDFRFTKVALAGQTRCFFAARLKYSRWMFVCFTHNMREETLLRCIIACFVELGGVPWAVTSDNMKTITLGRSATLTQARLEEVAGQLRPRDGPSQSHTLFVLTRCSELFYVNHHC